MSLAISLPWADVRPQGQCNWSCKMAHGCCQPIRIWSSPLLSWIFISLMPLDFTIWANFLIFWWWFSDKLKEKDEISWIYFKIPTEIKQGDSSCKNIHQTCQLRSYRASVGAGSHRVLWFPWLLLGSRSPRLVSSSFRVFHGKEI